MRALLKSTVLAESATPILVEGHPYFDASEVRLDLLVRSTETTVCPWRGVATYFDATIDGTTVPLVAWCYEDVKSEDWNHIRGRYAFEESVSYEN